MTTRVTTKRLSQQVEQHGHCVLPAYRQIGPHLVNDGSVVLLSAFQRYWCVSAAHVLVQRTPLYLGGKPFQIFEEEKVVHNSKGLDLAFFEITRIKAVAMVASNVTFLPVSEVDMAFPSDVGKPCALTGYPEKTVDIEHEAERQIFEIRPLAMSSHLLPRQGLEKIRRGLSSAPHPRFHMAATAGKLIDDDTGTPIKKIDFGGLSGGAIWVSGSDGSHPKLYGIVTDYDPKYCVVIGTRIAPLIEAIAKSARAVQ